MLGTQLQDTQGDAPGWFRCVSSSSHNFFFANYTAFEYVRHDYNIYGSYRPVSSLPNLPRLRFYRSVCPSVSLSPDPFTATMLVQITTLCSLPFPVTIHSPYFELLGSFVQQNHNAGSGQTSASSLSSHLVQSSLVPSFGIAQISRELPHLSLSLL